ncbi:chain A, Cytochrome P460 [Roseibium sp. TrichSKD4]|uniref:cytochrome P460 family protein n=1 Tax=Roseibium sp. TrichSKD4 TaxID=744980 RepID=UPI0001E5775C|nr:cytochrome P460 family protein [Roseibium sp. TrichSKD4]EFO28867.1 chain A, Cytochrome P460 [Roseibium sp. TrichSKD4]
MKYTLIAATALAAVVTLGAAVTAQESQNTYGVSIVPEWNEKGELIRPKGFRHTWVFLGSPFTPNALNGGEAGFPEYHNVYVQPDAFHAYRATGKWPEGTMFLKELQLTDKPGEEEDGSRYEVSGRGYFPGAVNGIDIAVKDSKRFADTQNWGYFNFGHHAPPYKASAPAAPAEACAQCHIDNADEDMVYVDFYKPILTPLPN